MMKETTPPIEPARRAERVGEYYFSRKLAEVRSLDSPELRVINLGIGSPDLAPSADVVETLVESARRPDAHAYQSYRGIPQLRRAIAGFCGDVLGASLDPESMILPLMGSKEGILHVSSAFVDEGDEVLIPDPGYPTYAAVTSLVGGVARSYRLREELDWGIDLDELERADLTRVKLMWINFPHMPTGREATSSELERLVRLARRNRFLLVNDNPYAMIQSRAPLSLLSIDGASDVALELGSLSKSHNMAGWRVGWVAGRREHVDVVLRVRSNMDSGMFLPVQHAAAKALESRSSWLDELNDTYASRRHEPNEILRILGCTFSPSQSGRFAWAKAPADVPDVEVWLDEILNETKVFITPGFIFGEAGRRHLRVALCSPVETLREARERIAALAERRRQPGSHALGSHPEERASQHPPALATAAHTENRTSGMAPGKALNVAIVGLGLIGGSIATDLRRSGFASRLIGVDASRENATIALRRGLVDELGSIESSIRDADVVVLAMPVDAAVRLAPAVLDAIGDDAVVIDTGSTKLAICEAIAGHPRRDRFVAAHPIAGTENSGPTAALAGLFRDKVAIICERERSADSALDVAEALFSTLGMRMASMGAREHDLHLAYVSHLSHVTSFVLGQTVLDIENDEKSIFLLAGSGFASTVRLAKSSPDMWTPIFDQNATHLTKALDEYIVHLQRFRTALADHDAGKLHAIMTEANEIRRVLADLETSPRSAGARPNDTRLPVALHRGANAPASVLADIRLTTGEAR